MANINSDLIALSSHIIKIKKYLSVKSNMLSSNSRFHFDTLSNRYILLQSNPKKILCKDNPINEIKFPRVSNCQGVWLSFFDSSTYKYLNIHSWSGPRMWL